MTTKEQKKFINEHLFNELRWLLCAVASWQKAREDGTEKYPPHFIVFTMDSAFLHVRSLFEFFTHNNPKNQLHLVTWYYYGLSQGLDSPLYSKWMQQLHHHVMHLENRLKVNNVVGGTHLKNMPFKFAIEIVRLWQEFSSKIDSSLKLEMDSVLERSIGEAEKILPDLRSRLGNN